MLRGKNARQLHPSIHIEHEVAATDHGLAGEAAPVAGAAAARRRGLPRHRHALLRQEAGSLQRRLL